MKKLGVLLLMLLFVAHFLPGKTYAQTVTTAAINGRIFDAKGVSLPGATVIVTEVRSKTYYGTVSDNAGFYRIPNMNVGGPYEIAVSYLGYQTFVKNDIFLALGQTYKLDVKLEEKTLTLPDVVVTATMSPESALIDGNRTGAETYINNRNIQNLPSITRSLADYIRLTPQASVNGSTGEISIAGVNNRYNRISFDGAVNNDVFGLSASGTNGGQTGVNPISLDAVDQFQVNVAPYDVRQGGFAGASINAVTRRGTNKFEGSVYMLYRDENMAGKTPGKLKEGEKREKLDDFSSQTYGLRVSGPIVENKLFFFLNAELQRDETPQPFDMKDYTGNSNLEDFHAFSDKLSEYGYNPGNFANNTKKLESEKMLARIDWNINSNHKMTIRHSYVDSRATSPNRSNKTNINYFNNGYFFPSITNSSAIELRSNWNRMSNNLVIGYTRVEENRDYLGDKFPAIRIYDGLGTIWAGSERYSTGNELTQEVLTLNENFSYYLGAHTLTMGLNAEYTSVYNLYIRNAFGYYTFNNLDDFLSGNPASIYERSYSLLDQVIGDGSKAAVDVKTLNNSIYAQDEWQLRDNLKLTFGIRFNLNHYLNSPDAGANEAVWKGFNDTIIPKIEKYYDLDGAKLGKMPKPSLSIDPRIGFNWDVFNDKQTQVRGGTGLFTSRIPLVWTSGSFINNGVTIGSLYSRGSIPFIPDWDNQYMPSDLGLSDGIPSGQLDLFSENFKNPQVLKTSLAVDQKLPWFGLIASVEGIYTKNINNVIYYNVNQIPATETVNSGPDNRPYYDANTKIDNRFTQILLGTNTNKGHSYNLTFQLTKPEEKGFYGTVSYTFGRSKVMNEANSSQNISQWKYMENINGLNNIDLSYSDFDLGSRVMTFISYKFEYGKHFASTFSLVYNGQSGRRYSYVYNDNWGQFNGENQDVENLIWIPKDQSEINLIDIVKTNGEVITAAQQWENLNSFIESDKYLRENRGSYAERNGARLPFESIIDLRFVQDFYLKFGETRHNLQLTLDIFNFTNLLNREWGMRRYVNYDACQLIKYVGTDADGKAQFNYEGSDDVEKIYNLTDGNIYGSRWSAQIGIRYIFN
ncbi:MAG: TonB-dependent receptor [Lentimicrobiaceae bacterium]|jgi:outer membrane receptor for ferrienterochelin and colicin|nr:TonB-dependent receptor [Lentimicrobiaceae bacterium]